MRLSSHCTEMVVAFQWRPQGRSLSGVRRCLLFAGMRWSLVTGKREWGCGA